jgi:Flp pilus assembly protein TadG
MRGERMQRKGQSLVEVALVLPVLLMLMLGLLDLGRAYYAMVSLRDAADEGAMYASIDPENVEEIRRRTVGATPQLVVIDTADVAVEQPPLIESGQGITVTAEADLALFTPFVNGLVSGGSLTLRGAASHPIIMVP